MQDIVNICEGTYKLKRVQLLSTDEHLIISSKEFFTFLH